MEKIFELKDVTERIVGFIEYFVDLFKKRSWVRIIILIDLGIFTFLNPFTFKLFITDWIKNTKYIDPYLNSENYTTYWSIVWLIVIVTLFLIACFIAFRTRQKSSSQGLALSENTAVKGLSAFSFDDAKLFEKLGRSKRIRQIGNNICESSFRFGILSGESGCGKSSLLQAGIWPYLMSKQHYVVYVQCNKLQPMDSIRYEICHLLNYSLDEINELSLQELLDLITNAQSQAEKFKSTVLILDQFEQFFINHHLKKNRKPFIKALHDWHSHASSATKVLISLRSDLAGRMVELQNEIKYSLGPNQNFFLEKFEPTEAAKVFKTIINQEQVKYDDTFIDTLCQHELASSHDGLVSPVDLQILAWLIAGRESTSEESFDKAAFLRLGGMDGLLNNFLNSALKSLETEKKQQIALKVLLSLIDLDNNLRAGVLTESELIEKNENSLTALQVKEAIKWLTFPDVRLVIPRAKGEEQGFELAHERIIASIRFMTDKIFTNTNLANQILIRRTNEWIGNGRSSNYLLNLGELRLIQNQKAYLIWQPHREQKQELIRISQKRYVNWAYTMGGFLLFGFFVYTVNFLPMVQIWKVKQELLAFNDDFRSEEININLVSIFSTIGMFKEALSATEKINDESQKVRVLTSLSKNAAEQNMPEMALDILNLAAAILVNIKYGDISDHNRFVKAKLINSLSKSAVNLNKPDKALELLNLAIDIIKDIKYVSYSVEGFLLLIETADELGNQDKVFEILNLAIIRASHNTNEWNEGYHLTSLGEIASKLKNKPDSVIEEILNQLLITAEKIKNFESRSLTLGNLSRGIANLNKPDQVLNILNLAKEAASNINDNCRIKASTLLQLGAIAGQLNKPEKSNEILYEAISATKCISFEPDQTESLLKIINTAIELNILPKNTIILDLVAIIAAENNNYELWGLLSENAFQLNIRIKALEFLNEAITSAENINNNIEYKSQILGKLSDNAINMNESDKAVEILIKAVAAIKEGENKEIISTDIGDGDDMPPIPPYTEKDPSRIFFNAVIESNNQAKLLNSLNSRVIRLYKFSDQAIKILDQLLILAEGIEEEWSRLTTLQLLSTSYAILGNSGKATEILIKTITEAEGLNYNLDNFLSLLVNDNRSIFEFVSTEEAITIVNQIENATKKLKDSESKVKIIISLSEIATDLKEDARAFRILNEMVDASANYFLRDEYRHSDHIYMSLGEATFKLKNPDNSKKILGKFISNIESISDHQERSEFLRKFVIDISINLPKKHRGLAFDFMDQVIAAASRISDRQSKNKVLSTLSDWINDIGKDLNKSSLDQLNSSSIQNTLEQLFLETINIPSYFNEKDYILQNISKTYAELGKWAIARSIAINHIKSEQWQIASLISILENWNVKCNQNKKSRNTVNLSEILSC